MERLDGRTPAQLRPVTIEMGFQKNAAGSCLVSFGNTRVICAASVENNVPPFLTGKGKGWLTAEYAMLPASTQSRKRRDGVKQDGRSVEIQRLIGRSLRAVVDLEKLGERHHPPGLRCFGCRWGNAHSLHYRRLVRAGHGGRGIEKTRAASGISDFIPGSGSQLRRGRGYADCGSLLYGGQPCAGGYELCHDWPGTVC